MSSISVYEQEYIFKGIKNNIRNDGRSRVEFRYFEHETPLNIITQVKLSDTEILVSISLELAEPLANNPMQGRLEVFVDFGVGIQLLADEMTTATCLSNALQRFIIGSNSIDLNELCIIPHSQCWVITLDCLILHNDGNLLDALSIGCFLALKQTRLPLISIATSEDEEVTSKEIIISEDIENYKPLPINWDLYPITISFIKFANQFVVDATLQEEQCNLARMTFAINSKGQICGSQKSGFGSFEYSTVNEMIENACIIASKILKKLLFDYVF